MDETEYLLATEENKNTLRESIKQVRAGKTVNFKLVEEESSTFKLGHHMENICADYSVFKKDPLAAVKSGNGQPVAVCEDGVPMFYCIPARLWESIMELLEDQELLRIATERLDEESKEVSLDEL